MKRTFLSLAALAFFTTASFAGILAPKDDAPAPSNDGGGILSPSDTNDRSTLDGILPPKATSTPTVSRPILPPKTAPTPAPRRLDGILPRKS